MKNLKIIAILATLATALTLPFAAHANDTLNYRVGDKATEDIITPVLLVVVDPVATEALKEKESTRIPVVFRFNESSAILAEDEIRAAFATARSNFLVLMHSSFHHTKLEESDIATDQFDRLITSFKNRSKNFPINPALAGQWARGEDSLVAQAAVISMVRGAMSQPIRFDNLTNAPKIGSQVRLVKVSSDMEAISLDDIEKRGGNSSKTNLLTLSRARLVLQEKFSEGGEDSAKFASRFLRPNCFVESDLTLQARARHVESLLAADTYQAGQTLVTQGQVIDRKAMAAIGQLRERTVAGRLQQQVTHQQQQVEQIRESNRWVVIGLVAAVIALAVGIWRVARSRRQSSTLLPATLSANMAVSVQSGDSNPWEQRALEAEAKAERAQEAIRQGVFDQLREKVVTGLASQRSELLNAQQSAAAEMAELEKRLNELQAPLQDRLQTYERRIADLEKQLAAKDQENIELIKAKIDLMRKQLEAEKAKDSLRFN